MTVVIRAIVALLSRRPAHERTPRCQGCRGYDRLAWVSGVAAWLCPACEHYARTST